MGRAIAFFLILVCLFLTQINITQASAQESSTSGIAYYITIGNSEVEEGDVVTLSNTGYVLSTQAYDPNIFGVVVNDPAVAFESHQEGDWPVVSQGKVILRVSTKSGKIKKGDLLTTSDIPGVAQKANESGFIAATALEDYEADPSQIGKILVVLSIGHGSVSTDTPGSVLNVLKKITNTPFLAPVAVLRFIVASVMVFASFLLAVNYFGRISSLGIEALGRNPLAGKTIIFAIAMNVFLGVAIISVGIAIAYLIMVL